MTSFLILNKDFLDGHTDRSDMVASMHQEITKILVVGSMRWHGMYFRVNGMGR